MGRGAGRVPLSRVPMCSHQHRSSPNPPRVCVRPRHTGTTESSLAPRLSLQPLCPPRSRVGAAGPCPHAQKRTPLLPSRTVRGINGPCAREGDRETLSVWVPVPRPPSVGVGGRLRPGRPPSTRTISAASVLSLEGLSGAGQLSGRRSRGEAAGCLLEGASHRLAAGPRPCPVGSGLDGWEGELVPHPLMRCSLSRRARRSPSRPTRPPVPFQSWGLGPTCSGGTAGGSQRGSDTGRGRGWGRHSGLGSARGRWSAVVGGAGARKASPWEPALGFVPRGSRRRQGSAEWAALCRGRQPVELPSARCPGRCWPTCRCLTPSRPPG